jgi:molecular chaperone GrpE
VSNTKNDSKHQVPEAEIDSSASEKDVEQLEERSVIDEKLEGLAPEEGLVVLREYLEELAPKTEEYLDGWQRSRAEFANYKKRMERIRSEEKTRVTGDILLRFIDAMDDFDLALKGQPEQAEAQAWAKGIEMIFRKMQSVLEIEAVHSYDPTGQQFDPNFHEAVSHEESDDHEEGQIIDVIRQGYTIKDRVLRPALVRVAK